MTPRPCPGGPDWPCASDAAEGDRYCADCRDAIDRIDREEAAYGYHPAEPWRD